MVIIRLARAGAKKSPFYHIVVTDSRNRRDGRFIKRLGYFNPIARGKQQRLSLQLEEIDQWQKNGAQLSSRVISLIKEANNPKENRNQPSSRKTKKHPSTANKVTDKQPEATNQDDIKSE